MKDNDIIMPIYLDMPDLADSARLLIMKTPFMYLLVCALTLTLALVIEINLYILRRMWEQNKFQVVEFKILEIKARSHGAMCACIFLESQSQLYKMGMQPILM